ncbi:MAG: right-handed parallel beta-helix repeat-containing protein, partial [Saprospiraceae bacterium]|nr:right-handed parallel beta-helix repeat-containing protein [Saprospiraceae bacterium]
MTLSLTLLTCLTNLNAQVRYVNPDGLCDGNSPCYTTIQAAVTAATAGDIIYIADGTYNERVVIDKSLTLDGESEGGTILDGTGLMGTGKGILINSNVTNVTIQELTVRNYAGSSGNTDGGIYANGGNNNLTVQNVTIQNNVGGSGFYANGPVDEVLLNYVTSSGHTVGARGIVIWNGLKSNITITNCEVFGNNCCGIELQDGSASGVILSNNTVYNNGDNGIGLVGLDGSVGANTISGNILTDNGRFGIEVKNPNGGTTLTGNTISRTVAPGDARDLAGIAVMRRGLTGSNVDVPTGVTVTNNTVSGYTQPSNSEGFGIVIGGTNHTVTGNTVTGNDVGIQQQAGHTPYPADGDQSNLSDSYFGRDNSPIACGSTISGNTLSSNGVDTREVGGPFGDGFVTNATSNETFCSIQSAIADAQTLSGHTLAVKSGSYTENVDAATPAKNISLAPGSSPGCVTINGNMTLNSGDALNMEVNSATACSGYDQFIVNGTVDLGGATLNLTLGYTPSGADAIMLINNDGVDAVVGTFAQGSMITVSGTNYIINYTGGSGNDVVLTRQCADVGVGTITNVGNVTLSTQTQVNAFKNGSGFKYTAITGNLTIDGNGNVGTAGDAAGLDPITNLCNLSELASVTGNVVIRDFNVANNPTTLGDLAKLTTVGGSLTIGSTNAADNNKFTSVSLPALNAVGGTLTVNNNTVATTVSIPTAFPAASAAISVLNNADLQTLTLGVSSTTGNVTINTNGPDVATINLSALTSVGGSLTMSNNVANATAADITLSALTTVGGSVNFTRTAKSLSAPVLATLGASGALTFSTNNLTPGGSLSLPVLGNVPGALAISDNTGLNGISIPTAFTNPTASVNIDGNAGLQSVVLGVKSTTTDLFIQSNGTALTTVTLSNLMTVGRHLDMNNAAAHDVSGTANVNLSALVSTGGRLRLVRAVKTLSAGSLTDVGTDGALSAANRAFTFQRNSITDLDVTFPALLNIGGNLNVTNNTSLSQCCIIPCKLTIGGTTTVSGNTGNCATLVIAQDKCIDHPDTLFLAVVTEPDTIVACGEEVEISVVATDGMTGLQTLDYFILWDTTKFEYVPGSISAMEINGLPPTVNEYSDAIGYWFDFNTPPVTMNTPPGVTLMTFTLRAIACTTGSPVYFASEDPYYSSPTSTTFCPAPVPITITDLTLEVPDVTLECPNNVMASACLSQSAIDVLFNNWLEDVAYGGGCDPVLTRTPETPTAPSACGGVTTVTWSVTSDCGTTESCTKTFTVADAPAVVLNCPADVTGENAEAACQTQDDINMKFSTWLGSVSHSGGCNAVRTFSPEMPEAPPACGGSTTVTWTVTSDCEDDVVCSATFTVTAAPDVTISCPENAVEDPCQTQEDIDAAFAAWLLLFDSEGGCNTTHSFDGGPDLTGDGAEARASAAPVPGAPLACGGSTTVTFRVTSSCEADVTCERTFTVTTAPDVTISCPEDATEAACQTQGAIDEAFANWLESFGFTGGCGAEGSFDSEEPPLTGGSVQARASDIPPGPIAPDACGGSTTVTYRVTSDCEDDVLCTKTFTVTTAPDITLTCPVEQEEDPCQTQEAIDLAFANWLDDVTYSGGCNAMLSRDPVTPEAPDACGGSTTVTWTVMS